ncbi:hypothetical protein MRX96_031722 [Rhipicephalus microplus]
MVLTTPLFVQSLVIWTGSAPPICFADIQLSEEYRHFKPLLCLPNILAARKNAKFPLLPVWNEPLIRQQGATVNVGSSSLIL